MSDLQIFEKAEFGKVRVVMKDGEPWFVAKDVCKALELNNPSEALRGLDEDEKITLRSTEGNPRAGIPHEMSIISEPGLYSLIFRSRKPEAKAFKRWITHEVIPSIRKTGIYSKDSQFALPDFTNPVEAARAWADECEAKLAAQKQVVALEEKTEKLEGTVTEMKPKALFADSVATSKSSILIGQLATILRQNGVDIGQNRLFDWLRDNNYLVASGSRRNCPTQRSMDLGLFEVKERTVDNPDGSIRVTLTTKVTGKGQIYFVNKFLEQKSPPGTTRGFGFLRENQIERR